MASRAMAIVPVTWADSPGDRRQMLGRACFHDFAAVVVAASRADMVWKLLLATIGALDRHGRLERVMRTSHVTPRLRRLLLGNCHLSSLAFQGGGTAQYLPKKPEK